MTPSPPTVDHLPSSGLQNTTGPKLFVSWTIYAVLSTGLDLCRTKLGSLIFDGATFSHRAMSRPASTGSFLKSWLLRNMSLSVNFRLSRKLSCRPPTKLAKYSISVCLSRRKSLIKREICSESMFALLSSFSFVLSTDLYSALLKINLSSWQIVTRIMEELKGARV